MKNKSLLPYLTIVSILALGFMAFKYYSLTQDLNQITYKLQTTSDTLTETEFKNETLVLELNNLKNINDSFVGQIASITDKVTGFVKLKETDKEFLQKYSKVFFLNEHYVPKELSPIDTKYTYQNKEELFETKVLPFLIKLMDNARENKIPLEIISAYRSFETQSYLKDIYTTTYGFGANKFSADQGYSEHQLGTAVDFTTPKIANTFSGFSKTETFKWLTENAYKYGFILSYPKNNTYYQFEPWHWRFVGIELAKYLHENQKNFYDLDQREIDKYLINFFDPI